MLFQRLLNSSSESSLVDLLGVPIVMLVVALCLATVLISSHAHCQVPCGIFNDEMRVQSLFEDHQTIAKAMAAIQTLAVVPNAHSFNQATRWVATKEEHCDKIINLVTHYFLAQKMAVVDAVQCADDETCERGPYEQYLAKLAKHHRVIRAAVKVRSVCCLSMLCLLNQLLLFVAFLLLLHCCFVVVCVAC
jgi:hypothetical protein